MKSTFVKRGRLEIIYEILSVCRKPVRKTRVLYRCNLSYDQLQKYLKYLISQGLLSSFAEKRKEFFQLTDKGKELAEEYEHLNILLNKTRNKPLVLRNSYSKSILHNHEIASADKKGA